MAAMYRMAERGQDARLALKARQRRPTSLGRDVAIRSSETRRNSRVRKDPAYKSPAVDIGPARF